MMEAKWAPVTGYDREYTISDAGTIISSYHGREMRPWFQKQGYRLIKLRKNGCDVACVVHRLVWEAFNGAIPPGLEINHKNGNKSDNRLSNLELVTSSENSRHAFETGLQIKKLTQAQILEMVEAIRRGSLSKTEAAEKYNVSPTTVTKHVKTRLGPEYIWKPGDKRRRRKKSKIIMSL